MDKQWYVIHHSKKVGPFLEKEILDMLKTGSLMRSQKVWKDGLVDPITCYDLFLANIKRESVFKEELFEKEAEVSLEEDDDDSPPPLPPLPTEDTPHQKSRFEEFEAYHAINDLEEDKEEVLIHKEIVDFKRMSGLESQMTPPLPPDIIRQKDRKKRASILGKRFIYLIAAGVFLFLSYFVVHDLYKVYFRGLKARPSNVDIKDFKILERVFDQKKTKLAATLVSSKDAASLIMGTNFIYDADIEIELQSEDGRVLANEPIIVKSSSTLEKGEAFFDKLKFVSGDKIYPGYYKVKINSSNEKRNLYWYDQLYDLPQKVALEDMSLYLGHLPVKIFDKKLKRFLEKRDTREKQFISDLSQKWETVESIVSQLKLELMDLMDVPAQVWTAKVGEFEKKYTRVFGSFFSEFYLQNEQVRKQLERSDVREKERLTSQYSALSSLAEKIGKKVVEILERASGFNYAPNQATRIDMKKQVEGETTNFSKSVDEGKRKLKNIIELDL